MLLRDSRRGTHSLGQLILLNRNQVFWLWLDVYGTFEHIHQILVETYGAPSMLRKPFNTSLPRHIILRSLRLEFVGFADFGQFSAPRQSYLLASNDHIA